jgi:ABC-type uncharacterized transport system substrate-binding protein
VLFDFPLDFSGRGTAEWGEQRQTRVSIYAEQRMPLEHFDCRDERGRRHLTYGEVARDDGLGLARVLADDSRRVLAAEAPFLAALLRGLRRRVAVIVTPASTAATLAAKAATAAIPIVFTVGVDPVKIGLVASLNRPSSNATGISDFGVEIGAKRLGLLHELLPGATRFGVLVNPDNPFFTESFVTEVQTAASAIGREIEVVTASTNSDIDAAFPTLVKKRADALLISPDPLFTTRRVQFIMLAVRHALPALYHRREFTEAGGLMSYGADLSEQHRQAGVYVGRILKGEKPAEMPVQLPTRFEFVINLQTARTIALDIPPTLLARADEVIE